MESFRSWMQERFPYPTKLELVSEPTKVFSGVELRDRMWELHNAFFSEGAEVARIMHIKMLREAVMPGNHEANVLIARMLVSLKRS